MYFIFFASLAMAATAAFTGCEPASNAPSGAPEKPNIIFVLADFLPTFSAIAGQPFAGRTDGIDLEEELLANNSKTEERILYRAIHEQGGKQAFHECGFRDGIELYDLASDPFEITDVAAGYQEIAERIKQILAIENEVSESFPFRFKLEKR